jgi:hypothetical protein
MIKPVQYTTPDRKHVPTYKNTSFLAWKALCEEQFAKMGRPKPDFSDLRQLHGYESGDTPYGWCDFIIRQYDQRERTARMKRDNPSH